MPNAANRSNRPTRPTSPTRASRQARVAAQTRALTAALDRVRAACDVEARLAADPVGVVRRYASADDRELVALVAATVAFGNVKAIRTKLDDALARLGPRPSEVASSPDELFRRLDGWIHRVYRGEDLARLLLGARRLQTAHGSLGQFFAAELQSTGSMREALARLADGIRHEGGLPKGGASRVRPRNAPPAAVDAHDARDARERRGPSHLLPDVRGSSGSKRLLLFLRWMVRSDDGVDLGLWPVSPSVLLVPVDTHIHKLARNLGLTKRRALSWKTTEEITAALAKFDAADPAKYDFALCHMGMLQRCPSRRDAKKCEGCGVKPVCRHWQNGS
jgi:uncharacterized protein (TIGR02757 family)